MNNRVRLFIRPSNFELKCLRNVKEVRPEMNEMGMGAKTALIKECAFLEFAIALLMQFFGTRFSVNVR